MALKATDIEIMVAAERLFSEGRLSMANLREIVRGGSSERLRACIKAVKTAAESQAAGSTPASPTVEAEAQDVIGDPCFVFSGRHCRVARCALDLTTRELAILSGLDRNTIEQYERGQRTPKPKTLFKLMGVLESQGIVFLEDGICWRLP